jgi:cob(I)alamin adenosyltransferase
VRIYSKTGDKGETGLIGGERVPKHSSTIDAVGHLDELNSFLGFARITAGVRYQAILAHAQNSVFEIGSEVASPPDSPYGVVADIEDLVQELEQSIDQLESEMPPLTSFILPGDTEEAARLHLARSVCRRAERVVAKWREENEGRMVTIQVLNRLSDWLFVAARHSVVTKDLEVTQWSKK